MLVKYLFPERFIEHGASDSRGARVLAQFYKVLKFGKDRLQNKPVIHFYFVGDRYPLYLTCTVCSLGKDR